MVVPSLPAKICYQGSHQAARWAGYQVDDGGTFRNFLTGPVRERVKDAEVQDEFRVELRGLATTGMATEFLERFLKAVPEERPWEVGEALAECLLEHDTQREVVWPWNSVRDRRTPRASLPGADLVGFCRQGNTVRLVFGEVKTSSDKRTPPGVMKGGSGMTWQLEANATRDDVRLSLLEWLRPRCTTDELVGLYHAAVGGFLQSQGKAILIIGALLRDTVPDQRDIAGRAATLAGKLDAPTEVDVVAWYLPVPIAEWPALIQGDGP